MKNRKVFVNIVTAIFIACIIVPFINLGIWIFTERWSWPELLPEILSLRALKSVASKWEDLSKLISSSILISSAVALLSIIIGLMTARAIVFYNFEGKGIFYFLSIFPYMVSSTVFAMGIHVIFISLGLNNRLAGIILSHLIYSLPYATGLIIDACIATGLKYEEQAMLLGASRLKAFIFISLPLLMPVIISAFSMAYIVSFSQYFMTLLLGGGKVKTFSIVILPMLQSGDRNVASIYSMIFQLISLTVFAIFEAITGLWFREDENTFYG